MQRKSYVPDNIRQERVSKRLNIKVNKFKVKNIIEQKKKQKLFFHDHQ
jgi:hypothetical protein